MLKLRVERLREYLSQVYGSDVKISFVCELGEALAKREVITREGELKGFGYGIPYLAEFVVNGETKRVVLETLRPEGFGHDHFSDRAQVLIWQHSAFNQLPKHVRAVDVGAFAKDGETLKSLGDCVEFFILTDFVEGTLYHRDLDRLKEVPELTNLDEERCVALSEYLAEIHSVKKIAPELYVRRIRDLIGHGECVFGLTDSYPSGLDYIGAKDFVKIEKSCVEWRWRLKTKTHRLAQVHGDFHPWNIMFRQGVDFTVLDRSRGEWGEPADDVTAMTINYIFYSLQTFGKMDAESPFYKLFKLFWRNYLDRTGDEEILTVVQPFYAWRGLVIASPLWYPNLPVNVRKNIFRFVHNVLKAKKFEFENIDSYV